LNESPEQFDRWCARVNLGVMETLYVAAAQRARLFQMKTGSAVEVVYPAQAPIGMMEASRELLYMKLTLEGSEIYLYSARSPGKPPTLNLVSHSGQLLPTESKRPSDFRALAKQRVSSMRLCRVLPTRDGGYVLYEPGTSEQRTRLDDVVHRLFDELVRRSRP